MPVASPQHAQDPILVALGASIRELRVARGMSQEDLADLSAIDRSYLSSIERGGQNPGVMLIARIAQAMNVKVAKLFEHARL